MTDMDMSQYLGAFLDETDDNLQRLDDLLLALEKNMVDMDVINEIFRAAHTLKGMAGTMGFTQMMGLTHAMEDRLDEARKETLPLTETDMNLLFSGLDSLQAMADSIRGGGNDAHIAILFVIGIVGNAVSGIFNPAAASIFPHIVDEDKLQALTDMRDALQVILTRGLVKNITRDEVHAFVDEFYDKYTR